MATKKNYQGNQQNYDTENGEYRSGPKGAFSDFGTSNATLGKKVKVSDYEKGKDAKEPSTHSKIHELSHKPNGMTADEFEERYNLKKQYNKEIGKELYNGNSDHDDGIESIISYYEEAKDTLKDNKSKDKFITGLERDMEYYKGEIDNAEEDEAEYLQGQIDATEHLLETLKSEKNKEFNFDDVKKSYNDTDSVSFEEDDDNYYVVHNGKDRDSNYSKIADKYNDRNIYNYGDRVGISKLNHTEMKEKYDKEKEQFVIDALKSGKYKGLSLEETQDAIYYDSPYSIHSAEQMYDLVKKHFKE